jgi:hypothetical protein
VECRQQQTNGLVELLGDPCEAKPAWFQYVMLEIMAVGAITGVSAFVAAGQFGASQLVIFTAQEAGGFIF